MYFPIAFDTNYITYNVLHAFNAQIVIYYDIKAMNSNAMLNTSILGYENPWINDMKNEVCSMYSDTQGLLTARP